MVHTHTHTPRHSGADKMTMKVKWIWQLNESYFQYTCQERGLETLEVEGHHRRIQEEID